MDDPLLGRREEDDRSTSLAARASRARDRGAHAESRAARDPEGGIALHWVAHAWSRCAGACERASAQVSAELPVPGSGGDETVWELVADAWEAAAVAWFEVAIAHRRLSAARLAEDARDDGTGGWHRPLDDDGLAAPSRVVAVVARRVADDLVREAERREYAATP